MESEAYNNYFKPWYGNCKLTDKVWNCMEECPKQCRAVVYVLSKAMLAFRKVFQGYLDIYTFEYKTFGNSCIYVCRHKVVPSTL